MFLRKKIPGRGKSNANPGVKTQSSTCRRTESRVVTAAQRSPAPRKETNLPKSTRTGSSKTLWTQLRRVDFPKGSRKPLRVFKRQRCH